MKCNFISNIGQLNLRFVALFIFILCRYAFSHSAWVRQTIEHHETLPLLHYNLKSFHFLRSWHVTCHCYSMMKFFQISEGRRGTRHCSNNPPSVDQYPFNVKARNYCWCVTSQTAYYGWKTKSWQLQILPWEWSHWIALHQSHSKKLSFFESA